MLSDYEKLLLMFSKAGISYSTVPLLIGEKAITLEGDTKGVGGYSGFTCIFLFTIDGALKSADVGE